MAEITVLSFHIQILEHLFIWPKSSKSIINMCFIYLVCCLMFVTVMPCYWTIVFLGNYEIEDFLEASISIFNTFGYATAYYSLLKNKGVIEKIIKDINIFQKYCPSNIIQGVDTKFTRLTKFLLIYIILGIFTNAVWKLISIDSCKAERGAKLLKHDPCGLPSRTYFIFDVSKPEIFWFLFVLGNLCVLHICLVFVMASSLFLGLLAHISTQLTYCAHKFETFNYQQEWTTLNKDFLIYVNYHRAILTYAKDVFRIFRSTIDVYITITSVSIAIIGYQIVTSKDLDKRFVFTMLLCGWQIIFFLICNSIQHVQDKSISVSDALYNSKWTTKLDKTSLRLNIVMVISRAQKPISYAIPCIGVMTLERFLAIVKSSYSIFTLLVTTTDMN
ncbi:hypothetical protein ABEB36_000476 [Hypothenemus hampei]|uniref:Odorant receptor n=1 Tax=Hypothenemus hampei TaxID=57062 RepID=A0ABD1FDA4_HYPHA